MVGCAVALGVVGGVGCGFGDFSARSSDFFSAFFAFLFFFFGLALGVGDFLPALLCGVGVVVSSSSSSFGFFLAAGVSLGEGDALGFFFDLADFFLAGLVDFVGDGEASSSSCCDLRKASRLRFSSSVSCA